jgi:hypothetical protein
MRQIAITDLIGDRIARTIDATESYRATRSYRSTRDVEIGWWQGTWIIMESGRALRIVDTDGLHEITAWAENWGKHGQVYRPVYAGN